MLFSEICRRCGERLSVQNTDALTRGHNQSSQDIDEAASNVLAIEYGGT